MINFTFFSVAPRTHLRKKFLWMTKDGLKWTHLRVNQFTRIIFVQHARKNYTYLTRVLVLQYTWALLYSSTLSFCYHVERVNLPPKFVNDHRFLYFLRFFVVALITSPLKLLNIYILMKWSWRLGNPEQ